MKRPNFEPIFESEKDYCEVSGDKPIKDFIPHQALDLAELIRRFDCGQRLNVHNNFAPGSNMYSASDEEAFNNLQGDDVLLETCPPTGVYDIVDVQAHYEAHEAHKREFKDKLKQKKQKSQQAQSTQAQQDTVSTTEN